MFYRKVAAGFDLDIRCDTTRGDVYDASGIDGCIDCSTTEGECKITSLIDYGVVYRCITNNKPPPIIPFSTSVEYSIFRHTAG